MAHKPRLCAETADKCTENTVYLKEMFGILLEHRIEGKMVQVRMLISSMMIEVNEVFDVVMRTNILDILRRPNENIIRQSVFRTSRKNMSGISKKSKVLRTV